MSVSVAPLCVHFFYFPSFHALGYQEHKFTVCMRFFQFPSFHALVYQKQKFIFHKNYYYHIIYALVHRL
ncbi:hypothetical protein MtrunA17_Chr3g0144331 [Medicago truncatula]|uniref:Uncharacterized protein n=1 Tax=Medicago truncatula TaxID=3880 RepID=A0A396IZS9_MEDTR|nr:hypothetical protein MtrunA17_Chr3g0144331 [Medicago truncatula]